MFICSSMKVLKYCYQKLPKFTISIIQYGCVGHCILEHVAELILCTGPSMEPTIVENDILISEHISSHLCRFDYGDIVIAKNPFNSKERICKRIVGLPGDKVKSATGIQYVPSGHVWLEGDNRDNSLDSRDYGAVPQGLIKGRALCRIWPPKDVTMLTVKSPY